MTKKTAYLAGPMDGAKEYGLPWRLQIQRDLASLDISAIVPHYEERMVATPEELKILRETSSELYKEKMREIMTLDLELLSQCDFVIAQWNGEMMAGTIHEVGKAWERNIPCYLISSVEEKYIPGWFYCCFDACYKTEEDLMADLRAGVIPCGGEDQIVTASGIPPQTRRPFNFASLGQEIGELVDMKQQAYGNSFSTSGNFLQLLYPNGIQPEQYENMLPLVRIFDKMVRIATNNDPFGESPWRDIAGYAFLGEHSNKSSGE